MKRLFKWQIGLMVLAIGANLLFGSHVHISDTVQDDMEHCSLCEFMRLGNTGLMGTTVFPIGQDFSLTTPVVIDEQTIPVAWITNTASRSPPNLIS